MTNLDPWFAVIKTPTGQSIVTTQQSATDATGNTVVIRSGFSSDQLLAGQSHIPVLDE